MAEKDALTAEAEAAAADKLGNELSIKSDFNFWPKGFRLLPEKPTCDHGGQDGKYPHPRDIAGVGGNDLAAIDFFSFGFFCIHWAFFGESCQIM